MSPRRPTPRTSLRSRTSFGDLLDEFDLRNGSGVDVREDLFGLDVGCLGAHALGRGRSVSVGARRARPAVVAVAATSTTFGDGALRVGQQRQLASGLDGVGDVALVLLAVPETLRPRILPRSEMYLRNCARSL